MNSISEFDFQWKNIPSDLTEYNQDRINEFRKLTKLNPKKYVRKKFCLDAGCGNGRYTFAMLKLGAMRVDSFDISPEAINQCKKINPNARVFDLMELETGKRPVYDFVFCWGVLNHISDPRKGFSKIASQVSEGGCMHIMVYHEDTQKQYEQDRERSKSLTYEQRLKLCEQLTKEKGGTVHGWFDALNPQFNHSFSVDQIKQWFIEEGLTNINLTQKYNINMNGIKK